MVVVVVGWGTWQWWVWVVSPQCLFFPPTGILCPCCALVVLCLVCDLAQVPFALFLVTHAYFTFYHTMTTVRACMSFCWLSLSACALVEPCVQNCDCLSFLSPHPSRAVWARKTDCTCVHMCVLVCCVVCTQCQIALRRVWTSHTYLSGAAWARPLLSCAVVVALAYFTAFMETLTISEVGVGVSWCWCVCVCV